MKKTKSKSSEQKEMHSHSGMMMNHWEQTVKSPEGKPMGCEAFNPMPGKRRPTTHIKTNECDY